MEDGLCLSLSLNSFEKSPPPMAPPLKPSSSVYGLSSSDRSSSNKPSIFNKLEYFSKSSPPEVRRESRAMQLAPNTTLNLGWNGANPKTRGEGVGRDMIGVSGSKRSVEMEVVTISSSSDGGGGRDKKKLRLSKEQSALLEHTFLEHSTLNNKQKLYLAKQLNLKPRQVEVWFQNRRARTKLKQTEVDCEFLRKYCEKLSDENKRLHKELQELRSPPNNLVLCHACGRRTSTVDHRHPGATAAFSRPAVKPNVSGLFSNKTTLLKI